MLDLHFYYIIQKGSYYLNTNVFIYINVYL